MLDLTEKRLGDGRMVATINGKTYTMLEGIKAAGDWCFLVLAGRTPLRFDDLDEHWMVLGRKGLYLAASQRVLSYHLCKGEEAERPLGCKWPNLTAQPSTYVLVGLSEDALIYQLELLKEQYALKGTILDLKGVALRNEVEGGEAVAWTIAI